MLKISKFKLLSSKLSWIVSIGAAEGLTLALGETDADGLTDGLTLGDTDGETEADGLMLGDSLGEILGDTEGLIEAEGLKLGLADGEILALGEADGLP